MYVLLYNIPNYILVIFLFICWEEGEDEGKNRKKEKEKKEREMTILMYTSLYASLLRFLGSTCYILY